MAGNSPIIIDTGPIVALLNRRDNWHGWTTRLLSEVSYPLLTCESVISEACFVVRNLKGGPAKVLELVNRRLITAAFQLEDEIGPVLKLVKKYRSVPMTLADACLVRMAEQYGNSKIITLDTDFHIYRKHGRQVIPLIIPL